MMLQRNETHPLFKFLGLILLLAPPLALANDEAAPNAQLPPMQTSIQPSEEDQVFHLSGYEPLYFIFGKPATKVKCSFKYRLVDKWNFYFGYNQFVFWKIGQDSTPFEDVTYSPEFFYRWKLNEAAAIRSIDIIPYWHMSNGKEGLVSRSLDRAAIQMNLVQHIKNDDFRLSLRVSTTPFNLDNENRDIKEYIGPWEIRASYSEIPIWFIKRSEISLRYFTGGSFGQKFYRGARELGLSFPLSSIHLNQALYVQYYEGNAEALLHYSDYSRELRIGLRL